MKLPGMNDVLIRTMVAGDIKKIAHHFCPPWSTLEKTLKTWETYYQEQRDHSRIVGILELNGEILGYASLLKQSRCPFFSKVPEICDLWIDEKYRRQGLATRLIQWFEELARKEGYANIGIGVGLYRDYGPAQQLYVKLGFKPDGNGITYHHKPVTVGASYPVDDDLLLWLIKPLC